MITEQLAPAALPEGQRVYAIGDVHGCDDRLAALHRAVAADLAARPVPHALLVHLGDYIDRGPDSAAVLARIASPPLPGLPTINLMGNHEFMMLSALAGVDKEAPTHWLMNGGADSLLSWGISRTVPPTEWATRIPRPHLLFLRDLGISHAVGPYLFVHAGVRPGVPLQEQTERDLLWIRDDFLSSTRSIEKVVVHGHTPEVAPYIGRNRIGIDTGAYATARLTAVRLFGAEAAFLETHPDGAVEWRGS